MICHCHNLAAVAADFPGCCTSCHGEWADGGESLHGGPADLREHTSVCCKVFHWLDGLPDHGRVVLETALAAKAAADDDDE